LNLEPSPWAIQPAPFCEGFFWARVLRNCLPGLAQQVFLNVPLGSMQAKCFWHDSAAL
jgi:hypothetical protein